MSHRIALLIIGGGPAGSAAAGAFREAGGAGSVAIVTDEHRMPYSRPPLTKELLRGEIQEDELPLEDESWLQENQIQLVSGRAVTLDPAQRRVTLSGGRELAYETCLLATGGEPTRLPVPGADDPRVRVLRSLDHLRELERALSAAGHVIVIGSGFIGCEIAASLRTRGPEVTLFSDEPAPNARRLGDEPAAEIAGWLSESGVALRLGAEVQRIDRRGGELIVTAGAEHASAPLVVMAAGVTPRAELAAAAGLELADGAIQADASMRTAADGVLAAGDVCRAENATAGRPLRVEHWGDALGHGSVAGRTAAGVPAVWDDVPGFWSMIGAHTLKYAAWGDGYDHSRLERCSDGAFAVWYGRDGAVVGVLAHGADDAYARGRDLIAEGAPWN